MRAAAAVAAAEVGADGRRKAPASRVGGSRGGGSDAGRSSLPKDDSKGVGAAATAAAAGERRLSRRNSTMVSMMSQQSGLNKRQLTKAWNIRPGFEAKGKFRKMVRFIMVFIKWIKALREEAEKDSVGNDFADMARSKLVSVLQTSEGDSFDVKEYITKKEITLSTEVRSILTLHPSLRTPEQVQTALYGLQLLRSFAEYPVHMQEKLAKVAFFQEVPRKRVIIRQGHDAENFYFVLSGYASVTTFEKNPDTGESVLKHLQYLRKGSSFGELALLHHERRTSTVVSQEDMHLLAIGRSDFFRIFMQAADGNDVPEHIRFVSTLDIMKDLPIEKLAENPDMCLFHFFRRGDVIVKDSTNSDWIYVVKNGACQVIKKLDGIVHQKKSKAFMYEDSSLALPKLGIGEQGAKTDSGLLKKAPALINVMKRRLQLSSSVAVKEKDYLAAEDDALPLLEKERQLERNPLAAMLERQALAAANVPLVPTTPQMIAGKSEGFTRSKFRPSKTFVASNKSPLNDAQSETRGQLLSDSARRRTKKSSSVKITIESIPEEGTAATQDRGGDAREVAGDAKASPSSRLALPQVELPLRSATTVSLKSIREEAAPEADPPQLYSDEHPPTYIQLDLLKPRDIFGLMDIKFGEYLENKGISVSLISKGVELVMINKRFFIDNASDRVKYAVLQSVRPYPDVKTLKGNFEIMESWEKYREKIWKKAITQVSSKNRQ